MREYESCETELCDVMAILNGRRKKGNGITCCTVDREMEDGEYVCWVYCGWSRLGSCRLSEGTHSCGHRRWELTGRRGEEGLGRDWHVYHLLFHKGHGTVHSVLQEHHRLGLPHWTVRLSVSFRPTWYVRKLTWSLLRAYFHTDRSTYVSLSIFIKYFLCVDFKFGISKLEIFMSVTILCKHYGIP